MKSDSQLLKELAHRTDFLRELTPEELVALKRELVKMYSDLANLCKQHGLTLLMSGGSCLGAVRHKGFIPWDDDLDVMMPRKDYEQLLSLLKQGALGEKYEYSAPNAHTESACTFLKIYLKDTLNVDIFRYSAPFPRGLNIDVFAIDAVPCNAFLRTIKGFIANGLNFCSVLTLYAKYHNPKIEAYMQMDKKLSRRYKIKCMLGTILGIIPRRKWLWWFDCWVADDNENKPWGIPTGRKYYNGEIFDKDVFLPASQAEFEGVIVDIPNDYDSYLKNLYHDYMQLPPLEQRERHLIVEFQLPKDSEV